MSPFWHCFLSVWDLVYVRRGEVLGGGEEIKDYTGQLLRHKEIHLFLQNQDVVKCITLSHYYR